MNCRRYSGLIVGGTQGAKRAVPITVPIYDADHILGVYRDYEQKTFVESLLQGLYAELKL